MKGVALLLLVVAITPNSQGQNNIGLKIYQNTDIYELQYSDPVIRAVTKVQQVNFTRISLAVTIRAKKFTHEIELLIPELSVPYSEVKFPMNYEIHRGHVAQDNATTYSFRYELSKTLTNKDKRFQFSLGAGINPYHVKVEHGSTPTTYYRSTTSYGFSLNTTPRIIYMLSKRFTMDLNVPLKVFDLRTESQYIANPAIPIRQQKYYQTDLIFFEPAYTIRLGLAYSLGNNHR